MAKMQWSLILFILICQCSFFTCNLYEYHFIDEEKTWNESQAYCRNHHTDLATVANKADMTRLLKLTENQREAWIGLCKSEGKKMWHWSLPGVEYSENETNWSNNEPNDIDKVENCARMSQNREWQDVECTEEYKFICHNGKTYLNGTSWLNAQNECRDHNTDLVSGLSQLEALKNEMNNISDEYQWIGLFRDTWRWSDGSHFSFRHWDSKSFDDQQSNCTYAMTGQGKWNNTNCDMKKPFLCYDDKVILINKNMTWEKALYYCRDHHRDLVSITNVDEQNWIQEKAKKASSHFVWLGLRYTCTLGFWFWVSEEVIYYKNWASDGKIDECNMSGAIKREGPHQWFSQHDNEEFNFICSKS